MRPDLITPFGPRKCERGLPLTKAVYGLHEARQDYAEELKQLSLLIGRIVGKIDVLSEGRGRAVTLEYRIKSLELNTGDEWVSDLIYWPEQYPGGAYDGCELIPAEILDIALTKRRSAENQS